jgi:alcohol dehydrogenase YqhD (iron-dependent ADH family)
MENFQFLSSTRIIFGKGTEEKVGDEAKKYGRKVLLHYGGGSIRRSGLYDRIVRFLQEAGLEFVELSGVKPNPRLRLVQEGIELCREHKIDLILAVGGGSVIDSAKAIAVGVPYHGDVWDFFTKAAKPQEKLPLGVVLTIPASGSESSNSCVITNEEGFLKWGMNYDINRPTFAIMNPELCYTLPPYQRAVGAVDIMAHIMERYFTDEPHVELTDRLCEAGLKTVINNIPLVLADPHNYDAWAELMLTGSLAHNGQFGVGRVEDWASHRIEHELSAIYDVAHGAGLATIFPAWAEYVYKKHLNPFLKFAVRVWNVDQDFASPERTALEGIKRMKAFFSSIGMPVTLAELKIPANRLEEMAEKATSRGPLGNLEKLYKEDVLAILKLAL